MISEFACDFFLDPQNINSVYVSRDSPGLSKLHKLQATAAFSWIRQRVTIL